MSQYFSKPYEEFGDNNVKVDLSNYAVNADIKNILHVDTSSFALKTSLTNLKTEVDKLDIDKLLHVPTDLSKLSNVVKNDVVKKTGHNTKITEIENKIPDTSGLATKSALTTVENKISDSSGLVKKTDYNTKITDLENRIPDISNLATKTALTSVENKIPNISNLATKTLVNKVESRIPDISNLTTKTVLTSVENEIPDVSNLVKKSDYDTKIAEIESKYVSNTDFNSKLVQASLVTKTDFDNKLSNLNRKNTKNKTDHVLVQNELNKLKTSDSSYFNGKSYFEEDGNYLIFQPLNYLS